MKIIVIGFLILFAQMVVGENTYATGNANVKLLCKLQTNTENATTLLRVDAPNVTKMQVINQFNTWGYEKSFGAKGVYKEIKFFTSDGIVKFNHQSLIN